MRRRFSIVLGILSVLALYTSVRIADLFPGHFVAAMAAPLVVVALFIGWQILYRGGKLREDSVWTRVFAWAASVGMGVWATFLLLTVGASVAALLLSATGRGAVLAVALPSAAAAASLLIASLGLGQAVAGPCVKRVEILVEGLPEDLRGLRIVQISDLHVGPTIRRKQVARVVERAMALKPDLIAITGDIADGTAAALSRQVEPLGRLKAPLGVYYVTGNHEYYWNANEWIKKMKEFGFIPLINENRTLSRGRARLLVGGTPDTSGGSFLDGHSPNMKKTAATDAAVDFRVLLAHRPDAAADAERAGFDLQLSGHTHGGQFFPASLFIGLFHRYSRGLYARGKLQVYVNPGTGYWGPAHRFAVPSEITLLTLTPAKKGPA